MSDGDHFSSWAESNAMTKRRWEEWKAAQKRHEEELVEACAAGVREGVAKERARWVRRRTAVELMRDSYPILVVGRIREVLDHVLDALSSDPEDAGCTCGSGGHPRRCVLHPHRYDEHRLEIMLDAERDENRDLKTALRAAVIMLEEAAADLPARGVTVGRITAFLNFHRGDWED